MVRMGSSIKSYILPTIQRGHIVPSVVDLASEYLEGIVIPLHEICLLIVLSTHPVVIGVPLGLNNESDVFVLEQSLQLIALCSLLE